jgi:hypothetical protein
MVGKQWQGIVGIFNLCKRREKGEIYYTTAHNKILLDFRQTASA